MIDIDLTPESYHFNVLVSVGSPDTDDRTYGEELSQGLMRVAGVSEANWYFIGEQSGTATEFYVEFVIGAGFYNDDTLEAVRHVIRTFKGPA